VLVQSTMQDFPLTTTFLFRHGRAVHRKSEVITWSPAGSRRATFAEIADRTGRLANALRRLGIGAEDRVGTFMWNDQQHVEAYFAVPGIGAVLHTLNLRLFPEQLAFVVNHAEDKAIIVDDSVAPLLARVRDQLTTVEHIIVVGSGEVAGLGDVVRYEELIAAEEPEVDWPDLDERSTASLCYTSGTTGDPKGVAYSHRSIVLHAFGVTNGAALPINDRDRVLLVVPMFHVNAWGLPYAAWMAGADMLMPERYLQAEPLCAMIQGERPTVSFGVPTIWNDVLRYGNEHPEVDLSSLRKVIGGGSATSQTLIENFGERFGVRMLQGWGMTETSPVCAISEPPRGIDPDDPKWRARTGRVIPGVELRIVGEDGSVLPADGQSQGEIEVRGPWITGSYYRDPAPEKFDDGWLRTGDVGVLDEWGFIEIRDRIKDVIKSGGEWISSVDLEGAIMAHPDVYEAAVVGVPDPKWEERPLAVVVRRPGSNVTADDLRAFLADRVAKWWVPERWSFVDELPKTSVGKFDKKVVRSKQAAGELEIEQHG
jgi:fatty-acyl-CoA synthase